MPTWTLPPSFDGLRVVGPLGRGGMGTVWLAHDEALDRPTALKLISAEEPSEGLRRRFQVEARALARLHHPNVVGVYRFGEVEGRPYLAYEFVRGGPVDAGAPLPWARALWLALGLARGLAAAHERGVVHRDVKPANVLVADGGMVKLLDFGLAMLDGGTSGGARATLDGRVAGTPAWMAPERWLGGGAGPAADVWAFGMLVRVLLTGRHPFHGLPVVDIPRAVTLEDLPPLERLAPAVPPVLASLLDRCLARSPDRRPASGVELRDGLEAVRGVVLPHGVDPSERSDPALERVAASFARIPGGAEAVAAGLYPRLFAAHPELRPLFPPDLVGQRQKLAGALALAVQNLRNPEILDPILRDLGRRHAAYRTEPGHFQAVGEALLASLADADRAHWDEEVAQAWGDTWARLARPVLQGLVEGMGGDTLGTLTAGTGAIHRATAVLDGEADGDEVPGRPGDIAALHTPTPGALPGASASAASGPGSSAPRAAAPTLATPAPPPASAPPASTPPAAAPAGATPSTPPASTPPSSNPPAGGRAAPGALPAPLTRFFGRERELDELQHQLAEGARLVTVLGIGGSGKTRLLLELGRRVQKAGGRVVWVPLADTPGRDGAVQALLGALALKDVLGDPLDAVAEALGEAPVVLLLDPFEQQDDRFADELAGLLERAPGLACVVGSQRALQVLGEQLYRLDPLPVPAADTPLAELRESAALRLLVDRARLHRPAFRVDETNAELLGALVRQLDGLPLGIELVAARATQADLASLLARLDADLGSLSDRSRTRPDRHRSIEAALRWSVDRLTPTQQALYAELSVFVGEFDAEDVAAVTGRPLHEAEDELAELAVTALLSGVPEAPGRYRYLGTVRVHAGARLPAPERERLFAAFCAHYAELPRRWSQALGTPEAARLGARLDRSWPNLLEVVDRGPFEAAAAVLGRVPIYVLWTARFGEMLPRYDRFLGPRLGELADPAVRAHLVRAGHRLSLVGGDAVRAEAWRTWVRRCLTEELDWKSRDGLESELAVSAIDQGRLAEAEAVWRRLLTNDEAAGNHRQVAVHLDALARVAFFGGQLDLARERAEECGQRVSRMGDPQLRDVNLVLRASIAVEDGRLEDATALLDEARAARRATGRAPDDGATRGVATWVALKRGELDEALRLAEETERGDRAHSRLHVYALSRLAAVLLARGEDGRAALEARRALQGFRSLVRPIEAPAPAAVLARALHRLGDPAADEALAEATRLCLALEGLRHVPAVLEAWAERHPGRDWRRGSPAAQGHAGRGLLERAARGELPPARP